MAEQSETQRQLEENRRLLREEMDRQAQELAERQARENADEWRN
jgi:hypothetical protein